MSDRSFILTALTEQPSMTLSFYSYGVMLRKSDGETVSEYPVDPAQIAAALAAKVSFDTGLLSGNTLLVRQDGLKKLIVEYRPPMKTGLFLDGAESALRVPLPGMVMIRATSADKTPNYAVFAVKSRPLTLDTPLFHALLPNVFGSSTYSIENALDIPSLAAEVVVNHEQETIASEYFEMFAPLTRAPPLGISSISLRDYS